MKTSFEYDNGQTLCVIEYKDHYFIGQAHCHPDDEDFMSEKTGCFIAESRAHQKYLKFVKNCEILPKLEALNHLKSTLAVWESDTPNYFSRRLNSEIKNLEEDLIQCGLTKEYADTLRVSDFLFVNVTDKKEQQKLNYHLMVM